jgi:glutaredoxin
MNAEPFRVYWQPGCSSCVKVKEFMKKLDIPFVSVNVLEHEGAWEELASMGARGFPVVARGKDFVFGQSLDDVAKFLERDVAFERLPPEELMERMFYFIDTALALADQLPVDQLDYHPIPNRDRSLFGLSYHTFQVPESFYETVANGSTDLMKYFDSPPPADVTRPADIRRYGESVRAKIKAWWDAQADRSLDGTVETFYGTQPTHKFLERSTWHTAQHVRQVNAVLDDLRVTLSRRVDETLYRGLPMPEGLWT